MHGARKCIMHSIYRCLHHGSTEDTTAELVHIHPSSSLSERSPPEFCVYHELVHTSRGRLLPAQSACVGTYVV